MKESPYVKPRHGAAFWGLSGDRTCHLGAVHRMVGVRERLATRDLVCRALVVAWPAAFHGEVCPVGHRVL